MAILFIIVSGNSTARPAGSGLRPRRQCWVKAPQMRASVQKHLPQMCQGAARGRSVLCSPSLELRECASASSLPHWVTASVPTNQELRSGGHESSVRGPSLPQRQTGGGAAAAAAAFFGVGLLWASVLVVFKEDGEEEQGNGCFRA